MRKVSIIILCILMIVLSACKKKEVEVNVEPTTISPTQSVPTKEPESTILTVTPIPTPVIVGKQTYTFQVQPVTIPQNMQIPYMNKEDFPRLDGSTANIPLGEAIYSLLTGASEEEAKKNLTFYTTPDSYRRLMNHEVDLLFVYEPSQTILEEMKQQNAEFEFKPLGRDALVFIENESNPVNSLTKEQIHNIYTGVTTNWSEVGGKDIEILPFQRPATSGSQTLMEKLAVSVDDIMNGPEVLRPTEMGDLIDTLAAYNNESNALGYSVFFYANYMYSKPGLKFVAIDGVMPNNETIQKGEYPYVNDFYVVIRKDEEKNSNARKIYDWMTTVEAQEILVKTGYVPVVDVSASTNTTSYGLEINGTMNILKDQYMILHNISSEQVYLGDSLLDRNFNIVMTFPGKYITKDKNLLCNSDEILQLESYRKNQDGMYLCYELYSLEKQDYISEDTYTYIQRTDEGYYVCYCYDYDKQTESLTILDSNGNFIKKIDNNTYENDMEVVQNHVVHLSGKTLTFYDQKGKELCKKELSYDKVYLGESSNWMNYDTRYLWLNVDNQYKVIFDKDGNEITSEAFLSKHLPQEEIPELWITNSIVATDGHLYATGNVNGRLILAREDGVVLIDEDNENETYNCSLYCNLYGVYNMDSYTEQMFTYKGKALNEIGVKMPETNDAFIDCNEGAFTVYCKNVDLSYVVKDQDYLQEFYCTEGFTIPELTQYQSQNNSKEQRIHSNFRGIRSFNDYIYMSKVGDYYIGLFSDEEGKNYPFVMDANGKDLYKGEANESIKELILGNELYMYVENGNYSGVKDLQGNYLYRQYASHLGDD